MIRDGSRCRVMFGWMDVDHLRKARSGSAFLAYGIGDVRMKILGDQDEDVDIDDGDTDTAPYIGVSLAGVSGGKTGVGTGAKSMAGSTLAPRVGVANVVSSTSSHGQREPHTAGSQASIGRQILPQLTAGEDGSPKYSDGSIPKVSTEGTSKRVHANDRLRISETSDRVRRLSSVQTLPKRKALETGPSTSTPTKCAKLHGNSCDSSDIVRKNNKTEGVQPRKTALCTSKEDLLGEESDKCPGASEMSNVDRAPPAAASLPVFEALKEEKAEEFAEYDRDCDQCKHGGELLCCDGRGCRKTFHLQCLDPPLEEVPETAFYCSSCLANASTPLLTQEVSTMVALPFEEDEFPSSDDHNSICEGCEVGGELMLCDGKGCKVVYHKECLDPTLQTVPAGDWYCPECEKRKVEKIWSVRNVNETSKRRVGAAANGSDTSSPESESEDDMPLDAPFSSSLQRPDGEVAASDLGKASGTSTGTKNTNLKRGVEYLVQWKSRSHAHDKWVSEKELEKQAPKELARFKKSLQLGQVRYDPEWAEPERVIQKRLRVTRRQPYTAGQKGNVSNHRAAEIEWFVKWKGLGYENCTWEPSGAGFLATSRGIELINEYERWTDAAKQRAGRESQEEAGSRVQGPFKALKCQPEWVIRPEQEQLDAYNKLLRMWHSRMNGIVVYEASQEKTVMTIMFFLSLVEHCRVVHPILVVVPKNLIQNWEHELYKWASKLYIVNYASKLGEARDIIRRAEFSSFIEPFRPQIVLTTFDVINCDTDHLKKVEWEVLIIDESRSQRLQKSLLKSYRPFSQINSTFRLLLLSEPLKSNVEELIQFINFLEPLKGLLPHGDESTQVAELRRRLSGRVFEYIPKKRFTEYWVPVQMTPVHLDQYYNLLVRNYSTLSRNHRDHQIQEVVTKLRQSCNHPFLADPALEGTMGQGLTAKELLEHHIEISGKMRLLHFMMPILKATGWRVIIFSQETKQLNILERYMTQSHGSDSYERVDHDIAVNAKEAALQRFNAKGSKRFVLLLKTGMHVSFKSVQFVLIYDSDWNPENDMRALHRIHNEGGAESKPLPVLRLYTHLTVEESTLALSRDGQLPATHFSAKICQKLLVRGASKLFDYFDSSKDHTRSSYRSEGAKFCPKAKLKQVVYNSEVVSKMLEALLCQDEISSKFESDVLLEAVLVPRDEPAPLFAENEDPINMITGDSAQVFWGSCLKWRHDDWQAKKESTLGKGQRGKKRVTYDEEAMASAVFNKAQFSEESERKRPRRRKGSSEQAQEVGTAPSDPVSFQQGLRSLSSILHSDGILPVASPQVDTALPCDSTLPVTSLQVDTWFPCDNNLPVISTEVDTALTSDIPERGQLQENAVSSSPHQSEVLPTESTQLDRQSEKTAAAPLASTKNRLQQDKAFIINVQLKEMQLMKSEADRKLRVLKRQHDDCCLGLSAVPGMVEEKEKQYKQDNNILERKNSADSKALGTRQRADLDKLDDLYSKLISSASGNGSGVDLRKIEEEIQRIKDYYIKLMHAASTPSPLQESVGQHPSFSSMPSITPAAVALPMHTAQVDDSSRVSQSSASPAEEQQRQHLGRVSSSGTPAISSQRRHAVQPVSGLGLPHSQRPAVMSTASMPTSSVQRVTGLSQRPAAMSTATTVQACDVQTGRQLQRRNTAVRPSPTADVPRGALAVSRSVRAPAMAPALPVGNMARPSVPVAVATLARSESGHVHPDALLMGMEKLSKELEKAKAAYESKAQEINAEYDREAEILHMKYEALLVEEHRSFIRCQQEVQQNIMKVEWNRQLAEALKLREELAARAAVVAGLATQTAVQPEVTQQAPQQISGGPRTTVVPVYASISRSTPSTINAGSGINATGSSRALMESVLPEMNTDVNGSPPPRTSPGVLVPTSPSFQDPIFRIIRYNMPYVVANSPSPSETVSLSGASSPNPHLSEPTAGMEYQIHHSLASPQTIPGVEGIPLPVVEGIPLQMTSQVRSGAQEQAANVATLAMLQHVIYLSDSDD